MKRRRKLERELRRFTDKLSGLLNRTVTTGVSLTTLAEKDGSRGWLGYGISRQRLVPDRAIPLTIGKAPPRCHLGIYQRLRLTPDDRFLVTEYATYGLYVAADLDEGMVLHYDYEREPQPPDGLARYPYPMPHVQVNGASGDLQTVCERSDINKSLPDLHLPVGSYRYRPTLEDIIHFVVSEGMADAHDGWDEVVADGRAEWEEIQLRAAVRKHPDIAREVLDDVDEGRT